MSTIDATAPVRHPERLFIGGEWVEPSSGARIDVIDSGTEELYYRVAEAQAPDIDRAVAMARAAFDEGTWPSLSHRERAEYLRAFGPALESRNEALSQLWPRESGTIYSMAKYAATIMQREFDAYAALADTFPFEELATPSMGGFGLLVREPVGTVGAIVPWNSPHALIPHKIGPALLAGCTVVLKMSPEAPGAGYVVAEAAEEIGLPPGVLNVVTADREVSELLVRDPRIDKITFTGSTAAGRKIGAILGERIARMTLELGGKSAAVILDDADIEAAAKTLARAETAMTGQVCSSLTRIVVTRKRQ
jgi:acyl-CoA reductase-like NAD-dependent aldehyde dehydrogenase